MHYINKYCPWNIVFEEDITTNANIRIESLNFASQ